MSLNDPLEDWWFLLISKSWSVFQLHVRTTCTIMIANLLPGFLLSLKSLVILSQLSIKCTEQYSYLYGIGTLVPLTPKNNVCVNSSNELEVFNDLFLPSPSKVILVWTMSLLNSLLWLFAHRWLRITSMCYLTIIPWAHTGYEMIDSQRGASWL